MTDARARPCRRCGAARALRTLLAGVALGGCGDFVEYDPAFPAPPAGDGGAAFFDVCADRQGSDTGVDASAYGEVLARRVALDDAGFARVDYSGWQANADDRAALDDFVDALGDATPAPCDLALWINAYNANVLQSVLERWGGDPDYSVDADAGFFSEPDHRVGGVVLSLDELEHGVVRRDYAHAGVVGSPRLAQIRSLSVELWQGAALDPRIHMALNCAARGCPNLRDGAYELASLDAELEDATRAFLDNAVKGAGPQGISQLFDWFQADFEHAAGSVERFIAEHRSAGTEGVELGDVIAYDWSLNGG